MSTPGELPPVLQRFGDLILATSAKVLASAVFVSGRELEEALVNSAPLPPPPPGREPWYDVALDRDAGEVSLSLRGGVERTARYLGDQGCVILPAGKAPFFEPVPVESALPDPATQPWPLGDAEPSGPPASPLDPSRPDEAVDLLFENPDDCTAAFLALHRGQIVAERYGPGIDRDTQLESWSMGKTITAALVGVLIRDGCIDLDDPAPIPEWRRAGDDRAAIRVRDLLQMSSGLAFSLTDDPAEWLRDGYPDHLLVYTGAVDVFRFSISRSAEHPPQTIGRYRNCDPLALGWIIQQTVRERGEEYLTFPQRALFDRIGIRRQVLETDAYGNFLLTGFDYGTARNWARLGLLFLRDGVFEGERILPEGFVEFVRTPAPAWERPEYGGQCWINGTGEWNLPADAYWMSGNGGQHVFVVPSHDLVIARMGHRRGASTYGDRLRAAQGKILAAIEERA
jgi:CubicO group peptidase (beta-lactamase class C family)